ncbi:MATE family efflux transporter [Olsenella sp. HMSC062G07]|uniref:MATE family efflux transporter n=1 Tax=Olsenella sp. HMSC062G07 TaxID=1739330 RepID=UPI0008CCF85B|nr:MATE family efflux transporter [Olsenella sp. HMSC062G07]OFK23943.1 MATE family efflux transporter [Olsenella sp. HMSC062G07]
MPEATPPSDAQRERIERARRLFVDLSPRRLFFTAAVPGALSMLSSSLYDLADGIFVGQILGEQAFAAVNFAMPFVIMVFAFGDLVGVGSSVPISIALGRGDHDRANNVFSCSIIMNVAGGGLLGGLLWLLSPWIMGMLGATGELADMAVTFVRMYALWSPVTTTMFAIDNYLRICGKIKSALALNVFMALVGAAVEFSLLYYARLGVFGAALGYCVAIASAVVVGMAPFAAGRMLLRLVRPRFTLELVREVMVAGMSAFLNNVASRLAAVILNVALLSTGGARAVSVYGMLMYAGGFIYPIIYGICDSLQPAVGYNWGARHFERVRAIERWCFGAAAFVGVGFSCVMFLFPEQVTRIFMADASGELLALAIWAFRCFSLTYLVRWFPIATLSLFTATENPKLAVLLSIFFALVAPLVALGVLWPLGLTGLWLNVPLSGLLSAGVALGLIRAFRDELHLR